MARFAPIAPLRIYRELLQARLMGSYHMVLAHEVVEDLLGFSEVFKHLEGNTPPNNKGAFDRVIILDNGTVELGHPMPASVINEAVDAVDPTYIILPDILKDKEATLTAIEEAMQNDLWQQWQGKFMLCPQGSTEEEILECVEEVIYNLKVPVSILGVGRWTANAFGTRKRLISRLYDTQPLPIHVLGFSENIPDDIECARMDGVIGIDSARPILLGLDNYTMTMDSPKDRPHRESSLGWKYCDLNTLAIGNLNLVREWIEQ